MLKKYGEIRHAMDRLHNTRLSNYERLETLDEIRRWVGVWVQVRGWCSALVHLCWGRWPVGHGGRR